MPNDRRPNLSNNSAAPSPALRREFWTLVVIFNTAILATGAGSMLVWFGVRESLGWIAIIIGVAAFGFGYGRYRRREANRTQSQNNSS